MFKLLQLFSLLAALILLAACASAPSVDPGPGGPNGPFIPIGPVRPTDQAKIIPVAATQPTAEPSPTQAPPFQEYKVRAGETLGLIASRYNVNIDDIMKMNEMTDANSVSIGQLIRIPLDVTTTAPSANLIPDSEAVYGPSFARFDVNAFAQKYGGYLVGYQERVEGTVYTGPQIIQLVAERFSVGPRVLLALLEMQGGWVTSSALGPTQINYPMGYLEPSKTNLYKQAFWVSSFLNEGYYGKLSGRLNTLEFTDRKRAKLPPSLNPGTAAIYDLFAHEATWDNWQSLVGPNGFIAVYKRLFGDPFAYAVEPIVPPDLKQPQLRLPLEDGLLWYFTGGPHAGWADGSAWAAVDFTPKDEAGSCWASAYWTVAAAAGKIVQAEHGRVILNLGDAGFQGIGWSLLYMHQAEQDRVDIGTAVKVGDHIGHPSCEGGAAETTHVHFARLYNGQWIPAADRHVPLVLSGWVFSGTDQEYDGKMTRGADIREAEDGQVPDQNGVTGDAGVN